MFLSLCAVAPSVYASVSSEHLTVASETSIGAFGATPSILTERTDVGLPDDFSVALEDDDSIELLRVDIEQRSFGLDEAGIGPRFVPKPARSSHPDISPPLLV